MTDSYTIRKSLRPKAENPETLRINEQHKRLREEFYQRHGHGKLLTLEEKQAVKVEPQG